MLLTPLVELFAIISSLGVHGEVLRVDLVAEGSSLVPFKLLRMNIHLLVSLFSSIRVVLDDIVIGRRNQCKSCLIMTCLIVAISVSVLTRVVLMLILSFLMVFMCRLLNKRTIVIEASHPVRNLI